MNTIKLRKKQTKMVAHRGLSGLEKENTAAAFIAAGNRSYWGCECDIHKTTDNRYIIIHDDNTKRLTDEIVNVEETSYTDLLNLDFYEVNTTIKKPYLKILLLEDYINILKKYEKYCVIEFKNLFKKDDVYEVIEIIDKLEYLDHIIFISFEMDNLIYVREKYNDIKLQYLTSELTEEKIKKCFKYRFGLDAHYQSIDQSIIDRFHNENLEVNIWTVNDKKIANRFIKMNIDYITTNILE